jgi:hypothetical protein
MSLAQITNVERFFDRIAPAYLILLGLVAAGAVAVALI